MANLFGIYDPPNLVFAGAIFAVLVYLLHLSTVASRVQNQNKTLSREIALLKQKLKEQEKPKNEEKKNRA